MALVSITPSASGHIGPLVRALAAAGWTATKSPARGLLRRNDQLLVLQTPHRSVSLRVLVYKIGGSGRNREHERRVEITKTYGHGLEPKPGYNDVVLGFDPESRVFVGLDPLRLQHGGETSNASSFVEEVGLRRTEAIPFIVLTRSTRIFPAGEHQAFFRPERLSEYLFNFSSVHAGTYPVTGNTGPEPLADDWMNYPIGDIDRSMAIGSILQLERSVEPTFRAARVTTEVIELIDQSTNKRNRRQISPEELRGIQQQQEENGLLGEEFVLESERRRLMDLGRQDLASQVEWVSRNSVGEGYDIKSYEGDSDSPRYIEVKSTSRSSSSFEISANEWARAGELGDQYYIYRVITVRTTPTISTVLRNPEALKTAGSLRLTPTGWRVQILA